MNTPIWIRDPLKSHLFVFFRPWCTNCWWITFSFSLPLLCFWLRKVEHRRHWEVNLGPTPRFASSEISIKKLPTPLCRLICIYQYSYLLNWQFFCPNRKEPYQVKASCFTQSQSYQTIICIVNWNFIHIQDLMTPIEYLSLFVSWWHNACKSFWILDQDFDWKIDKLSKWSPITYSRCLIWTYQHKYRKMGKY